MVSGRKTYPALPFCKKEILRYAGCPQTDSATEALLSACIGEMQNQCAGRVCYRILPVAQCGDVCDFSLLRFRSHQLALRLAGCESALLFAATVGVETDRLIAKYGRISPAKALLLQAIGAQQIEALCDAFCSDAERLLGKTLMPRFSPGYGDLAIETQRDIFAVLDCERQIGLTLNDSFLMSPSKSVTAIVGIGGAAPADVGLYNGRSV